MSLQQMFALVLAALLLFPTTIIAQDKPIAREQSLKAKMIEIPAGSVVSVKLKNKQSFRGKLGSVNDAGFELQGMKDGKISNQSFNYEEVKSVKHHGKGMSTAAKIALGALAGAGVLIVVGVAMAYANN